MLRHHSLRAKANLVVAVPTAGREDESEPVPNYSPFIGFSDALALVENLRLKVHETYIAAHRRAVGLRRVSACAPEKAR